MKFALLLLAALLLAACTTTINPDGTTTKVPNEALIGKALDILAAK